MIYPTVTQRLIIILEARMTICLPDTVDPRGSQRVR